LAPADRFVLLLLDYWPLGRLSAGAASGDRPASARFIDPRAALRVGLEKVPLLILTVASSIVTFIVQQQGGAVIRLEAFPFWQRAANAGSHLPGTDIKRTTVFVPGILAFGVIVGHSWSGVPK
jgi:hypothetical protein